MYLGLSNQDFKQSAGRLARQASNGKAGQTSVYAGKNAFIRLLLKILWCRF